MITLYLKAKMSMLSPSSNHFDPRKCNVVLLWYLLTIKIFDAFRKEFLTKFWFKTQLWLSICFSGQTIKSIFLFLGLIDRKSDILTRNYSRIWPRANPTVNEIKGTVTRKQMTYYLGSTSLDTIPSLYKFYKKVLFSDQILTPLFHVSHVSGTNYLRHIFHFNHFTPRYKLFFPQVVQKVFARLAPGQ